MVGCRHLVGLGKVRLCSIRDVLLSLLSLAELQSAFNTAVDNTITVDRYIHKSQLTKMMQFTMMRIFIHHDLSGHALASIFYRYLERGYACG